MSVQVVPTPLGDTPIICGFNYNVNSFVLNNYITFNIVLLDQGNTPLAVRQVTLAGQDYNNWGNNDQYVIQYICLALGLTQLNPPEVAPTVTVVPVPVVPEVVPDVVPEVVPDVVPDVVPEVVPDVVPETTNP